MDAVGLSVFIRDKNGIEVLINIRKIVTTKNDFEFSKLRSLLFAVISVSYFVKTETTARLSRCHIAVTCTTVIWVAVGCCSGRARRRPR